MENLTRRDIIENLIIDIPEYLKNESYLNKLNFLISFYECKCTDCNGDDPISECKLEKRYFINKDDEYQKFENVIMNTRL